MVFSAAILSIVGVSCSAGMSLRSCIDLDNYLSRASSASNEERISIPNVDPSSSEHPTAAFVLWPAFGLQINNSSSSDHP
jgi:hypothetical protein